MRRAIVKAIRMARTSALEHKAVILTSEGMPAGCDGEVGRQSQHMPRVIASTLEANRNGDVRIHTVFVGSDDDTRAIEFLRDLARIHGGTFRRAGR